MKTISIGSPIYNSDRSKEFAIFARAADTHTRATEMDGQAGGV